MNAENSEFDPDELLHKNAVNEVVLPEWLTAEFPEHLPLTAISFNNGKFHVSHDGSRFDTIEEAYDFASEFSDTYQVVLDSSVDGHGGTLEEDGFFFCDTDKATGTSRLLLSMTTEELVFSLKEDYLNWLNDISVDYNANPDNFLTAHKWLSHHPMFWVKGTKEKSFHWATDNGLQEMSINVWPNKETGEPVIFLEHGMHHEQGYTNFYHDDRIFAKGKTYEEAIITMAKNVNIVFDLDGNERVSEGTENKE